MYQPILCSKIVQQDLGKIPPREAPILGMCDFEDGS